MWHFFDFCKAFDSINWVQMEATLYAYQIPKVIVDAIMSLYKAAKAGIRGENGDVDEKDTFALSVGVLQGDTLAPFLFVIVVDFIMRKAMTEESLGTKLTEQTVTARTRILAAYVTDFDFADDIKLWKCYWMLPTQNY